MKNDNQTGRSSNTNAGPDLQLVDHDEQELHPEPLKIASDTLELRGEVREVMVRQGLTRKDLASCIKFDRGAVSKWLDGKYQHDPEAIEAAIKKWLATVPEFVGGSFVETPTAERIVSTLAYAQAFGDMVHIFGGPGVGKTTSINRFVQLYPDKSWFATITPASAGLVSALETVAVALGVGAVSGGARRISSAIRERLAQENELILILDEAQHLSVPAIEELRSIHDASGCGLALVGNETSYARLTGGARSANYAQIYSRIGARLQVQRPTSEDVDAICESWQVEDAYARAQLRKLAERPGALRSVTKVLRLITRSGAQVTSSAVNGACRQLGAEI